jgi:predicted dehydrogenase
MVLPIADRPVRVGVLGAGRWAQMAHLPGWARNPRTELVAVCDIEPQLAKWSVRQVYAASGRRAMPAARARRRCLRRPQTNGWRWAFQ